MKRILFLVPVFFFLSCASMPHAESVKQSDAHYQLGLSYMKEEKYQNAYVEFQKAIDFNSDNKYAFDMLGLVNLKFDDLDKSEKSFKKALDIDPDFSEAYNNLGVVYSRQQKWDKAIEQFRKALKNPLYTSPEMAYYNLGNALYREEKFTLSIKYYKDAILRSPDFYPAYYGLALGYNAVRDYGEAASSVALGIKNDPEIKGDRKKAVDVFNARMVISQDNAEQADYRNLIEILHY